MIEKIVGLFLLIPALSVGLKAIYQALKFKDYIALLIFLAVAGVSIQSSFGLYLLLK